MVHLEAVDKYLMRQMGRSYNHNGYARDYEKKTTIFRFWNFIEERRNFTAYLKYCNKINLGTILDEKK